MLSLMGNEDGRAGHLILIHEGRQNGEGRAGLSHDRNGHGGAHAVLPLLDLEVIQQRDQHILGPDGLGNVAERVDGGSPDALLVRLQHLQQLEADAHPLTRGHELGASVGDATHKVNAVLLHLLVPANTASRLSVGAPCAIRRSVACAAQMSRCDLRLMQLPVPVSLLPCAICLIQLAATIPDAPLLDIQLSCCSEHSNPQSPSTTIKPIRSIGLEMPCLLQAMSLWYLCCWALASFGILN